MKVTIRDEQTLSRVPSSEVAAYLRAKGWHEAQRIRGVLGVWLMNDRPDQGPEVLVPLDRTLPDYPDRIGDMLRALELCEERSQLEILKDIMTADGDVIRVRLDGPSDSVLLETGVGLIQGARDMLAAAACSTVAPKAFFPGRRPAVADDYLNKIRLGHTEPGSYVVTVVSFVPPDIQMVLDEAQSEPFERRVVLTLARALNATKTAAEVAASSGSGDRFLDAIPSGISANLCDALSTVSGDGSTSIDVSFSWAPVRPLRDEVPSRIEIPRGSVPYIKEAGQKLKAIVPTEDYELTGVVTRLAREQTSDPGTVGVYCFISGQPRHVKVVLSEEDYSAALRAHDDGKTISCHGNLVKEGRSYVLKRPHRFSILTDDEQSLY